MPTVSCEAKCQAIYPVLEEYIEFYSEKFERLDTRTETESDIYGVPTINTYTINLTYEELSTIANRLIPYIGGFPLNYENSSGNQDELNIINTGGGNEEGEEEEPMESKIVSIVSGLLETIFTDFTFKNTELASSEAWIGREGDYGTEKSSYYKIKSLGIIDSCPFLDFCLRRLREGIASDFSTLDRVKQYLTRLVDYVIDAANKLQGLGDIIISMDNFYHQTLTHFSWLSAYCSSCDYIAHQYYTDSGAWGVLGNWDSTVRDMVQTIEDRVPILIRDQKDEVLEIIADIQAVGGELNDNRSVELLEVLKEEVLNQFLSSYIDQYGYRLAQIIREMMSGVDRDTYDYRLIDKLTLIEQRLQQSILNATNRINVMRITTGIWGENNRYKNTNKGYVERLQSAIDTISQEPVL